MRVAKKGNGRNDLAKPGKADRESVVPLVAMSVPFVAVEASRLGLRYLDQYANRLAKENGLIASRQQFSIWNF